MTHSPETRRRPATRYMAFGIAAVPLALGLGLMMNDHAAGIAWALLVCGAGLFAVALTQPDRGHDEPPSGRRAGS